MIEYFAGIENNVVGFSIDFEECPWYIVRIKLQRCMYYCLSFFKNKLIKELSFVSIEYIIYVLVKKWEVEGRVAGREEEGENERRKKKETRKEEEREGKPSHIKNQSINRGLNGGLNSVHTWNESVFSGTLDL